MSDSGRTEDVEEWDVRFCSECGEPVPGAGASDHCERIVELVKSLEAVHDELKGLDTANALRDRLRSALDSREDEGVEESRCANCGHDAGIHGPLVGNGPCDACNCERFVSPAHADEPEGDEAVHGHFCRSRDGTWRSYTSAVCSYCMGYQRGDVMTGISTISADELKHLKIVERNAPPTDEPVSGEGEGDCRAAYARAVEDAVEGYEDWRDVTGAIDEDTSLDAELEEVVKAAVQKGWHMGRRVERFSQQATHADARSEVPTRVANSASAGAWERLCDWLVDHGMPEWANRIRPMVGVAPLRTDGLSDTPSGEGERDG